MLETPGQDYSKISRKVSSGMRRRSFQLLGLIIALIIQLQLITACGNANQAAPPLDTQNAAPTVPQEPGNTAPPAEMPAVVTPPGWTV
jgi:hypothetical protein